MEVIVFVCVLWCLLLFEYGLLLAVEQIALRV